MRRIERRLAIQHARLGRACALVAGCAMSVVLVCVAPCAGRAESAGGSSFTKRIWESVSEGSGFDEALEEVGIVKLTRENSPAWLEREIVGLDEMQGAVADGTFSVLWFLNKGRVDEVSSHVGEVLTRKGWLSAGSDANGVETYFKQEGECTWLMKECVQAGEDVAVVLHIRHT